MRHTSRRSSLAKAGVAAALAAIPTVAPAPASAYAYVGSWTCDSSTGKYGCARAYATISDHKYPNYEAVGCSSSFGQFMPGGTSNFYYVDPAQLYHYYDGSSSGQWHTGDCTASSGMEYVPTATNGKYVEAGTYIATHTGTTQRCVPNSCGTQYYDVWTYF